MSLYPGLFITFEGCEGCGKSTQARLLYNILRQHGLQCILTHEPGGTPLGNKIRDVLKVKRDFHIAAEAELFLFAASRFQLVSDVIRPALSSGKIVICDRFSDSTFVYQGYGRGLDLKMIDEINELATGGLGPDITILLDAQAEIGLGRKRNSGEDRFEAEILLFTTKYVMATCNRRNSSLKDGASYRPCNLPRKSAAWYGKACCPHCKKNTRLLPHQI